ncbi:Poly(A) polymerase central domain-containing protein [Mycena albidolilacea]|uniref:Poly(A) polymerase n=1 Tax=Mycena albidolilacea TaxID=1033008 RepID=A0AAD6ZZ47_9AGAR|nr:Poly(A) polymerase central domain-containing protein [Mycena albidolilacea]
MAANDTGFWGVTPPISVAASSEREREITATLMDELRRQNTFETEEESRRREIVLGRVAALVKKFVKEVSLSKGLSETASKAAGGKIFTFGSYRLGVHGPGTDIDTVCVVPKHVSREDFFNIFEPMLRATDGATEVSGVPGAFVPVISAKILDISLDLLIAPLGMSSIPDDLSLKDNNVLKNLDEVVVRSVNGTRLTDELLRLVPNVQPFRDALRCIKLWAQRKAIYSNKNGYLGGVAWAMLVARICQLYPNAAAGAIVVRFFTIMSKWPWPDPVLLKQIEDGPLQVRVWNPKLYPSDRAHRMPIITPNYPSMCATHNVSGSTMAILSEQIQKGADIVNKVTAGTATWSELFSKHDFFHRYRNYIQVIALSRDAQQQMKWAGTVESKIRHLIMKLEFVDNLRLAHPFVKGFDRVVRCASEDEARDVLHGQPPSSPDAEGEEGDPANESAPHKIYLTSFFIGLQVRAKEPGDVGPRRLEFSYSIAEFLKLVKGEAFDDATMGITLKHIRSTALPDYVFDPGERDAKAKITGKRSKKSLEGGGGDTPNKRPRLSTASLP